MNFIKTNYPKILITLLLLLLAFFSVSKTFDNYGEQYTDEGFERSLVSFAIAKGLNGAISIVQGTEVALEPAGVGVILTPGQILDPANDLIERFSWIMLICTISLGIQSILLNIFSSFYFSTVVTASLFLMVLFVWNKYEAPVQIKNILYRVAALLIILRFFIPVMAVTSEGMYTAFLEPMYVESTQQLEYSDKTITELSKEGATARNESEELSWYQALTQNINSTIDTFDVDKRVEELKQEVESLTNHIIDLIVIFTMQTILFPLLFLWLSLKLIKVNFSFRYFD
ncbi:MAG: hypothetical protein KAS57_05525 [Gammaproteobacteria bacterium]|nr:hypothetical protein [Gammaproteobacteria bacterium]